MHKDVPTKSVRVGGTRFVYRRLGPDAGVPVVFLNHLTAVLDNWDPRVVDGIAAKQGHCYANCQASGLDLLR